MRLLRCVGDRDLVVVALEAMSPRLSDDSALRVFVLVPQFNTPAVPYASNVRNRHKNGGVFPAPAVRAVFASSQS